MVENVRPVDSGDFDSLLDILEITESRDSWIQHMEYEWRSLWRYGAPFGFVASEEGRHLSMLMAVLTRPVFARFIRSCGRPYVSGQLVYRHEAGGKDICPDPDKLTVEFADSVGDGLHLHFVHAAFRDADPLTAAVTRSRIAGAFLQSYAGVPITSLTVEAHGEPARSMGLGIGLKVWNEFPALLRTLPRELAPVLLGATASDAITSGNHWLETMLCSPPPRLKLSPKLRRILYHASNGLGDDEIAHRIFLSPGSMKTYWDRIYKAFETRFPSIFLQSTSKRSIVLEFLRQHPEERWPGREANLSITG